MDTTLTRIGSAEPVWCDYQVPAKGVWGAWQVRARLPDGTASGNRLGGLRRPCGKPATST